jgi:hypothetical protein
MTPTAKIGAPARYVLMASQEEVRAGLEDQNGNHRPSLADVPAANAESGVACAGLLRAGNAQETILIDVKVLTPLAQFDPRLLGPANRLGS